MDSQTMFNGVLAVAIALIGGLGGFVLKAVWDSLKELQKADMTLIDKVHDLETEISGEYVKKDEFCRVTDMLFQKLDAMSDRFSTKLDTILVKVDSKVSKEDCHGCISVLTQRRRATDYKEQVHGDI